MTDPKLQHITDYLRTFMPNEQISIVANLLAPMLEADPLLGRAVDMFFPDGTQAPTIFIAAASAEGPRRQLQEIAALAEIEQMMEGWKEEDATPASPLTRHVAELVAESEAAKTPYKKEEERVDRVLRHGVDPGAAVTPTDEGKERYDPDGLYEGVACTCSPSCDYPCKGECGCDACHDAYQDYLSSPASL